MKEYFVKINKVNYGVRLFPKRIWYQVWKPIWHKGRGSYITIGIWIIAFYRGY